MTPSAHHASAGFTLLELLITVVLLGMLTVVLFGGLRFGTRAWEAAQTTTDGTDKILSVQATLAERVSAAYPLYIRDSPDHGHVAFDGSANSVTFLAPAKLPRGALEWVTVKTTMMNGSRVLAVWTALELQPDSEARLSSVLVKGLKTFDIAYFGADTPRDQPSWRSSWKDQLSPPSLVRMRATFTNRRTIWPDLVVPMHIAVDQGCTYDQLTNYCQGRI